MSTTQLVLLGACGGTFVVLLAYLNWRISVRVALVLVLLEGVLRKWVFPGFSDLIYFAKDFVLLGAYLRCFAESRFSIRNQFPTAPINELLFCCLVVSLGALNPNTGSIFAGLLGVKGYLFYLPLIVIMPRLFKSRREMLINLSCYTLLAIPICLLGFAQFQSDGFSVINTYASGTSDYGASMIGTTGKVRITGTFSYLSGHVVFVTVFFSLALATICTQRAPFRSTHMLIVLPLVVANAFMSGARASIAAIAIIAIGFTVFLGTSQSKKFRRGFPVVILGAVVTFGASQIFFTEAIDSSLTRFNSTSDTIFYRIFVMPMDNLKLGLQNGGAIGCGIGTTSPAVASLRSRFQIPPPVQHPGYYDNELGQILAELGFLGFFSWYAFRITITVLLVRSIRSTNDPVFKAIALAALTVQIPFMLMSLVLNHTACVLVWALTGLGMIPLVGRRVNPLIEVSVGHNNKKLRS